MHVTPPLIAVVRKMCVLCGHKHIIQDGQKPLSYDPLDPQLQSDVSVTAEVCTVDLPTDISLDASHICNFLSPDDFT